MAPGSLADSNLINLSSAAAVYMMHVPQPNASGTGAVVATMLEPPHAVAGPDGSLEVSIHRLGRDTRSELAAVLPDSPHSQGILAALTLQFAAEGVQRAADPDAIDSPPTAAQVTLVYGPGGV